MNQKDVNKAVYKLKSFFEEMDFETLFSNPKQFIDNIVQVSDEKPDLGIQRRINEFFETNPESVNQIPVIATLGHLQMTIPGTLVRVRCVIIKYIDNEYIHLRQHCNGKYYTTIYQQDIPEDADRPDVRSMANRICMLVSSIPNISEWLVSELQPDVNPSNPSLNLKEFSSEQMVRILEEPFQLNAKFLYEQPDLPCTIYDFIGFIDDDAPWGVGESFSSTNPTFIALTSVPVQSLYIPQIPSPEPSLSEVRGHLMSFLTQIFDPPQAELLLLWMIGSVKSRKSGILLGLFSLNLFGCTKHIAKLIIHLFKYLFTAIIDIPLSIDYFNSIPFIPTVENQELKPTPLILASGTRLIIDETELDVGNFNQTGIENCQIIRKIFDQQQIDYVFEGELLSFNISYPTLILSQTRTILSDQQTQIQAFCPVGNVNQPEINIDPNLLMIIRRYIENIRYCEFSISDEDSKFTQEQLFKLLQSNRELTQANLHFLMIIAKLCSISLGSNSITKEIWDHSVQILQSLLPHQK